MADQQRRFNPVELAQEFYNLDQKISRENRVSLFNAFKREEIGIPVGALGLCAIGVILPRWAAKNGFIKRPISQTRLLSVMLGMPGFMFGGNLGYRFAYNYSLRDLSDSQAASDMYVMMAKFPPQIGLAYFKFTSENPQYLMKDPNNTDWKTTPAFPLNLVDTIRQSSNRQMQNQRRPGPPQPPRQQQSREDNGLNDSERALWGEDQSSEDSSSQQSGGSSWDRIRSQNGTKQQDRRTQSSQDNNNDTWGEKPQDLWETASQRSGNWNYGDSPNPPRVDRPGTLTPTPPPPALSTSPSPPALSSPPRTRKGSFSDDEQEDFDKELERERLGQGLDDDFSDSEKKW